MQDAHTHIHLIYQCPPFSSHTYSCKCIYFFLFHHINCHWIGVVTAQYAHTSMKYVHPEYCNFYLLNYYCVPKWQIVIITSVKLTSQYIAFACFEGIHKIILKYVEWNLAMHTFLRLYLLIKHNKTCQQVLNNQQYNDYFMFRRKMSKMHFFHYRLHFKKFATQHGWNPRRCSVS